MESSTSRMVVTAAILAALVGGLIGWQASSSGDRTAATSVVRGAGYVHPDGTYLYIDSDGDGGSDHELAGLAAAEWWDGETWHGPNDNREQECLPRGPQPDDNLEQIEAGIVEVPAFGGGSGRPYVIWFRCPGTFEA